MHKAKWDVTKKLLAEARSFVVLSNYTVFGRGKSFVLDGYIALKTGCSAELDRKFQLA